MSEEEVKSEKCVVKWYDPVKGYGFAIYGNKQEEAFLHVSTLLKAGIKLLPSGTSIICTLEQSSRGMQVADILEIDITTATPQEPEEEVTGDAEEGKIKFFSTKQGYGFVTLDRTGKEAFVSLRVVEQACVTSFEAGDSVRVWLKDGDKGVSVVKIEHLG